MRDLRLGKDTTAHYSSFEEAAKSFGCKSVKKRTDNKEKLQNQREKFLGTCPYCKELLTYNGGNIVTCTNEKCRGRKVETKDAEGNVQIKYYPHYRLLDFRGEEIASNLFA